MTGDPQDNRERVGPGHELYDAAQLAFADVVDEPLCFPEEHSAATDAFFDRFWFGDHRNGETGNRHGSSLRMINDPVLHIALGQGVNAATASTQRFAPLGGCATSPSSTWRPSRSPPRCRRAAPRAPSGPSCGSRGRPPTRWPPGSCRRPSPRPDAYRRRIENRIRPGNAPPGAMAA